MILDSEIRTSKEDISNKIANSLRIYKNYLYSRDYLLRILFIAKKIDIRLEDDVAYKKKRYTICSNFYLVII